MFLRNALALHGMDAGRDHSAAAPRRATATGRSRLRPSGSPALCAFSPSPPRCNSLLLLLPSRTYSRARAHPPRFPLPHHLPRASQAQCPALYAASWRRQRCCWPSRALAPRPSPPSRPCPLASTVPTARLSQPTCCPPSSLEAPLVSCIRPEVSQPAGAAAAGRCRPGPPPSHPPPNRPCPPPPPPLVPRAVPPVPLANKGEAANCACQISLLLARQAAGNQTADSQLQQMYKAWRAAYHPQASALGSKRRSPRRSQAGPAHIPGCLPPLPLNAPCPAPRLQDWHATTGNASTAAWLANLRAIVATNQQMSLRFWVSSGRSFAPSAWHGIPLPLPPPCLLPSRLLGAAAAPTAFPLYLPPPPSRSAPMPTPTCRPTSLPPPC